MKRYTDDQKIAAVRIVERFGGFTADTKAALSALLDEVPSGSTLHGWRSRFGTKPESESESNPESESTKKDDPRPLLITAAQRVMIEQNTDEALDMMLERAARTFVEKSTTEAAMEEMNAREFMTAAGIAIDKMRIIRGLPTEIVAVLPGLMEAITLLGIRPVDFIQQVIEKARAAHAD